MKYKFSIAVLSLLYQTTFAHHVFSKLIVNGSSTGDFEFVRDVVAPPVQEGWEEDWVSRADPQITVPDMSTTNITCGRSAENFARTTKTATVLAGSQVGFHTWDKFPGIGHYGPVQIYMSRPPNDILENYQGDGDWFKIAYLGPVNDTHWSVYRKEEVHFTIPLTTPPGKYLLRIEHIWPQQVKGYAQHYVNCAHVNVVGPGGGTPTGFAKFPGSYSETDSGILIPTAMAVTNPRGLLDYAPPGPAVWSG